MSFEDIELPEEDLNIGQESDEDAPEASAPGKFDKLFGENSRKHKLSKMFKEWYTDYAS